MLCIYSFIYFNVYLFIDSFYMFILYTFIYLFFYLFINIFIFYLFIISLSTNLSVFPALSKSKQGTRSNYIGPQSMTLDRKKIKAKRGTAETLSLLSVDINSLEDDSLSKNRASSMLNISEAASGRPTFAV